MNRTATFGVALPLALLCSAAACNSSSQVASHFAKSQLVTSAGGTVSVSASDDATLAGTSIDIPANALSTSITITIAEGTAVPTPLDGRIVGPSADFGPAGTLLSIPAIVTLPCVAPPGVSPNTIQVVSIINGAQSAIANAKLTFGNGTVSFSAGSLGLFGCVAPPSQSCPAGQYFCGCPGFGGECIPGTDACALACPIEPVDGGSGGICPPGEAECCGVCTDGLCPEDACPVDGGSVCPPGSTYCVCLQECLSDVSQVACPLCDPLDGGTSTCPPGEEPCCPGDPASCVPSGVACIHQDCVAPTDGGTQCPPGDYFCGCPGGSGGTCLPNSQACALPCPNEGIDGGSGGGCPAGETYCTCTAQCIGNDQVCPDCAGSGDAGSSCPSGEFFCGCPGSGGTCEPLGTFCELNCSNQGEDGGV